MGAPQRQNQWDPNGAYVSNAAHFVAARGRTPATRTREQFATMPEAQAFGAAIGDGRTMIYAVTTLGHSAHITNA